MNRTFSAYQIHTGKDRRSTAGTERRRCIPADDRGRDGWIDSDGWVVGCYLHGLYENDAFRHGVLAALAARHEGGDSVPVTTGTFDRQREYDKLAAVLRAHLDIDQIRSISETQ